MKKRNRESFLSPPLPNSKKLNRSSSGVKSPKMVGLKKSKQNLKQGSPNWSLKHIVGGPITKDEEEVVETLYALAGMFPNIEADRSNNLDGVSSEASPSALQEASERLEPKLEASATIKEDLNGIGRPRTDEAVNPASDIERSPEETTKLYTPITQEPYDLTSNKKHGELDSSIAQVGLHKTVNYEEQKPACNLVNFCFPRGTDQDASTLRQPAKLENLLDRMMEISLAQTPAIGSQPDQQHAIGKSKNNGPILWPGLSSAVSSSACHGPLSQSCAAKIPAWLGTRPDLLRNGSIGKVLKVSTDRRSWKRCAAHVYIGCLIRALQIPERKESFSMPPPSQLRPHEVLKQGVLMTINDFSDIRNDLKGIKAASTVNAVLKNSNDTKSGILQHLKPHQDHSQAALASGAYTCQKKGFNFLSLSAGGGAMEPNNRSNGTGNGLEPCAQMQIPYHLQNPTLMPFSMSQTRLTPAYPDQPSAAAAAQQAQLQFPTHLTSPYFVPHASSKALTKLPQQQLWAAQLAAQYRNTGTSTAMTHFPSWPNGRQDSPGLMPYVSPSTSTLDVPGPKYPQISQQQQQLMAITLPHARMKRQSVYEENGVRF
ncbi:uncharacterized protein LOC110606018 isoform X2 [Manihot esculenta]|nr:uncharacterized protein LOC110606018 isoform X2 [Manihot esculenta]